MEIIIAFILINLITLVIIPFLSSKWKGIITIVAVLINVILSSLAVIPSLLYTPYSLLPTQFYLPGSVITGEIPIRIDALSAWFIMIFNFTFLTGAVYGFYYMKVYREQKANLSLHCISYIIVHAALISICVIQNSLAFLFAWEIMAIASFILIIFEHYKQQSLKAGINFLVQSHVSIVFLSIAFIWVYVKMNSFDFNAITEFCKLSIFNFQFSIILFFLFFIGFAIKAGFVPFHTWLPYAHPAAPSHVSGVMSGVIIKVGIYGILRMLLVIRSDYTTIGYIILIISVISGVYGVMLAIVQHNLKKLLAYHSIENIGIIGIGIGLGCIGLGYGNTTLAILGFAGALLHTLNHSLFKSLLFYAAGNVYQSAHTMNIEHLGGIIKRMPHTAFLFLIASLAICGLPPFNGFVSEFLIYFGLFNGIQSASFGFLFALIFSLFCLVLIGGLAMICFTKAFGIGFLGLPRKDLKGSVDEASAGKLIPMYAIAAFILLIGIFPQIFINLLFQPLNLFVVSQPSAFSSQFSGLGSQISMIGFCSFAFILLSALIFIIRKRVTVSKPQSIEPTWGCGYVAPNVRMQYTASSYIRTYRKLAEPILLVFKKKKEVKGIFPKDGWHETHPYDKVEKWLIDAPLMQIIYLFNRFAFMQNGKLQYYILYGAVFILLVLVGPLIYNKLLVFIEFLKQF